MSGPLLNGLNAWAKPKRNVTTGAPTVNDDETLGFEVLSLWADTGTGAIYICEDATTGAAVWSQLDATAVIEFLEEGVSVGSRPALNFIGSAVTAVDDAGNNRVNVTVSAASLTASSPTSIEPDDASVVGVATDAARADHQHAIVADSAGTISVGDAAAEGAASSFARSDHTHALPSPAAPANVTKAAASAGSATTVARADHKHDVSTAAPSQGIGASNAEGSATSLARSDHNHTIRESGGQNLTLGAIADGQVVRRFGTTLAGVTTTPVFGNNFASSQATARTTTTSNIFQTKVSQVLPAVTGTFLVLWKAHIDNANNKPGEFRLQNTTDAVTLDGTQVVDTQLSNDEVFVGGHATIALTGVSKTIAIEFRDQAGGNTQGIAEARVTSWRVA